LTNLGEAHAEGFCFAEAKSCLEKLKAYLKMPLYSFTAPEYTAWPYNKMSCRGRQQFSWSMKQKADLQIFFYRTD
jgi:hypothetical protein